VSAPELKRYMVPGGHGIEEHPSGLLHRREDVDKALAEAPREALREVKEAAKAMLLIDWLHKSSPEVAGANRMRDAIVAQIERLIDAEAPAPMRCAECDCDNPPHGCNWIKPGPEAPARSVSVEQAARDYVAARLAYQSTLKDRGGDSGPNGQARHRCVKAFSKLQIALRDAGGGQ